MGARSTHLDIDTNSSMLTPRVRGMPKIGRARFRLFTRFVNLGLSISPQSTAVVKTLMRFPQIGEFLQDCLKCS